MANSVQRISIEQWSAILQQGIYPRHFQADFVLAFAEAYELQYSIFHTPTLAFLVYHKGKNARMESHFFEQIIWQDPAASAIALQSDAKSLLDELKNHFDAIDLKMPINWTDEQILHQAGYGTKGYQTIIVPIHRPLRYSENVRRMLKKAEAEGYYVQDLPSAEQEIQAHIHEMIKNGIPKKHQQALQHWISYCHNIGYLKVFALYTAEGIIKGSALMLDDAELKEAYLLSIKSVEGIGQSPLYAHFIAYFQNKQYHQIDLWGGNIPSIANFKLKWDTEARPYFIANYRKNPAIDRLMSILKSSIKFSLKQLDFSTKGR
jgi:hypothetical protein